MAAGADPNPTEAVLSAAGAAQIVTRAELRVFGHGISDIVRSRMWAAHAVLQGVRTDRTTGGTWFRISSRVPKGSPSSASARSTSPATRHTSS
jgi:hypothetical protein